VECCKLIPCYTTNEGGLAARRTGKLALPHFVVELFFLCIPDSLITFIFSWRQTFAIVSCMEEHLTRILQVSLLESGVTTKSCGFSVKFMAVISLFIYCYLQECVNAHELHSQAFSS